MVVMRWDEFSTEAPDLAGAVRRSFDAGKHKVMATLRRDGAPRVSGTEVQFLEGDLWLGSMPGSVKAADLRRDPRVAIHSPTVDEELAVGDCKVSGRVEEITDPAEKTAWAGHYAQDAGAAPPEPFDLFRVLVDEVARTTVDGDHLVIESWSTARGLRRVERK
jgi:hypothetical protein